MSEEKTVKYTVVQGINNIQAVSAISQILMGKQIKEE